jgi:predicted RNA-binding protein with PIN domain
LPYLVDGNNLIGSWGGPTPRDDRRAEVVRRVAAFCRAKNARATIVFDGGPLRHDFAAQQLGRVCLRVPEPGADADSVIRGLLDLATRPGDWVIVTSDKALYSYAKTRGARVLRAHEWNALARRVAAPTAGEKPDREDDVDGWLRRFGASRTDDPVKDG